LGLATLGSVGMSEASKIMDAAEVSLGHKRDAAPELYKALESAKKTMRNCQSAIGSNQVVDKDVNGNLKRGQVAIDAALALARGEVKK